MLSLIFCTLIQITRTARVTVTGVTTRMGVGSASTLTDLRTTPTSAPTLPVSAIEVRPSGVRYYRLSEFTAVCHGTGPFVDFTDFWCDRISSDRD